MGAADGTTPRHAPRAQEKTFVRNRDVLAMVTALFGLLGCGGDDKPKDDGPSGRLDSKLCAKVCQRVVEAKCKDDDDEDECQSSCKELIDDAPKKCESDLEDYLTCAAKATFTCDADDEAVAKGCARQLAAVESCGEGPVADAGPVPPSDAAPPVVPDASIIPKPPDAGPVTTRPDSGPTITNSRMCPAASSPTACNTCYLSSCCDQFTACVNSTDCQAVLDCVSACNSDACESTCQQQHPAGYRLLDGLFQCTTNNCRTQCASSSSLKALTFDF